MNASNELFLIKEEIKTIIQDLKQKIDLDVSEEMAFNYLILKFFYKYDREMGPNYSELVNMVCDGNSDGGIDFVYFDDDEGKVILGQCKYTESIDVNTVVAEIGKMYATVQDFQNGNTAKYNINVKRELQEALQRLPDDDKNNIQYTFFTLSVLDPDKVDKETDDDDKYKFSSDMIEFYNGESIIKTIEQRSSDIQTVNYDRLDIQGANNCLRYESDLYEGIMVNISSKSLVALYNKYQTKGLFDLNIRQYIPAKTVDDGIKRTLDNHREDFWFLNNGIIIACKDFKLDGNKVNLYDFSIVNGGQTTKLIGTHISKRTDEFFIPCKIVSEKNPTEDSDFFNRIAEATNSQKPIQARDLKSNSREMRNLKNWLKKQRICLEIKRGVKADTNCLYKIRNDELGQLILTFRDQRPGTARSSKAQIFEKDTYKSIFRKNYEKSVDTKQFVIDLITMHQMFLDYVSKLEKSGSQTPQQIAVIKNGKYIIFAILGVLYRIVNNDDSLANIKQNPDGEWKNNFVYGAIIANYKEDDIDKLFNDLIKSISLFLLQVYELALKEGSATSISNLFKTDAKYHKEILKSFLEYLQMPLFGQEVENCIKIFLR